MKIGYADGRGTHLLFIMDQQNWYKLDNVAKIIPSSVEGADTRVFRVACELKEAVDPEVLQEALDATMEDFPHMNCCMRRGIFWYYLDTIRERVLVEKEAKPALASLYIPGVKSLLLRVTYYDRRISVEMFHVLADGTGGFIFLVHLLSHYLSMKEGLDEEVLLHDLSSVTEKESDAFRHYYEGRREQKKLNRMRIRHNFFKEMFPARAYQIFGERDEDLRQHLLEGTVDTGKLTALAHEMGVTIGVLVTSLYVEAILSQMSVRDKRRPIIISVPVNLRQFFPTATTRNFFGAIQVGFDPDDYDGTLESILHTIKASFEENLTEERIIATMNSYAALEHNYAVKMTPLFLKYPAIRGFNYWMKKGVTTSVSNLGKVRLPKELEAYVERFVGYMASRTAFMCISTYRDKTVFGVTSCFTKHTVFMRFFRRLTELGIDVELASNDFDREEK